MYNVILWHVHTTIAAMETQQCIPFLLLIYICHNQKWNKYWKHCHGNTAMHSLYCCTICCY